MSSLNKRRIMEMSTDRFHDLPDSLLIHILSFLDVRTAGVTSVLSKRWEYLWSELPRLEFKREVVLLSSDTDALNYMSWVNRTIHIREGKYLEKFMVSFLYKENFAFDVDAWIEFCVKNKVKNLILELFTFAYNYYKLPQVMYSCSSLTTLNLRECIMAYEGTIEWQSLTDLTLCDVELNQHLLDEILSSCPALNNLELHSCHGFNRLEVNSRCLNNLTIEESEDGSFVEVSAPYIRSLNISVFLEERKWQLRNISSVVTASIDFMDEADELYDDYSVEVMTYVKEFLEKFKHVNDLHLRGLCFEVLSSMMVAAEGWQLPELRMRHLTLDACATIGYINFISGICCLLDSSPNLESLLLNGFATDEDDIYNLDSAVKSHLDGDLLYLKKIRVNDSPDSNGEPLLTLARILLRRAPALEEMVIVVDGLRTRELFNISQTLLTYPRSSTKAQIHLSCK